MPQPVEPEETARAENAGDSYVSAGISEGTPAKNCVRTAHAAILRRLAAVEARVVAIGGHDRPAKTERGQMQLVAARVAALEARLAAVLCRLEVTNEQASAAYDSQGRQRSRAGSVPPTFRETPRSSRGRAESEEVKALVTRTKELLAIVGPIQESIETHFKQLQVHISKEHGVAVASLKQHVEALMDERFQQAAVDEQSRQAGQSCRLAPIMQRLSGPEGTPHTDNTTPRTGNTLTPCSFAVSSRSSSGTSVALSPPQCQVASRIMASAWSHQTASDHAFVTKFKLHDLPGITPTQRPKENIGSEQLTSVGQGSCPPLHQSLGMVSFTSLVMGAASRCSCAAWLAVAQNRRRSRHPPLNASTATGTDPFCSSHVGAKLDAAETAASATAEQSMEACRETRYVHI